MKINQLDLCEQFARLEWLLHRFYHQSPRVHGFGCLNGEEQAALKDYLSRIIITLEQQCDKSESERNFHGHWHSCRSGRSRHFGWRGDRSSYYAGEITAHPGAESGHISSNKQDNSKRPLTKINKNCRLPYDCESCGKCLGR